MDSNAFCDFIAAYPWLCIAFCLALWATWTTTRMCALSRENTLLRASYNDMRRAMRAEQERRAKPKARAASRTGGKRPASK